MKRLCRLDHRIRRVWATLILAVKTLLRIDGMQWAGAFAFNAFFALFPLMLFFVAFASVIIDRERAGKEIIAYMEGHFPISGEMQRHVFDTLADVIKVRGQMGVAAFLILAWVAHQCFTTLIRAIMRAWDTTSFTWWRLPPKSLVMLGLTMGAVLLSMSVSVLMRVAKRWLFTMSAVHSWVFAVGRF